MHAPTQSAPAPVDRARRSLRLFSAVTIVGDVLLLQLCWLVISAGIVTAVPASIALQRSLSDAVLRGRSASVRGFLAGFGAAWRAFWLPGVIVPAVIATYVLALLFWASTVGWVRIAALALLLPLGGLAFGVYLAALAATPSLPSGARTRRAVRRGWIILGTRPLTAAGCLILMVTWLLLLSRIPTLALVGLGIAPAFLALWLGRPRARRSAPVVAGGRR